MLDFHLSSLLLFATLMMLTIVSLAIAFSKHISHNIILLGAFSLLISVAYLFMDAPDVAMTEVALGACLSTVALLGMAAKLPHEYKTRSIFISGILSLAFAFSLILIMLDLPEYGATSAPIHESITKYYIENTEKEIGIPSVVAAILASYRGFDTLGETEVILIAGIGALLILSRKKDHPSL